MIKFFKAFAPIFTISYLLLVAVISLLEYYMLVLTDGHIWLMALPVPLILSIGFGLRERNGK
ncbi:hypothetical protein J2S36_000085 [Arcanobacterium hippocoleae]|uniref:Uncharacterized protein n=1 Tax=Arcanobacterium hippocoleae TaxID=149017 RepID=A0ABU1SZH6_9ACTO|nr:hypothetical protein [Arcanobacterium hippocoleae]